MVQVAALMRLVVRWMTGVDFSGVLRLVAVAAFVRSEKEVVFMIAKSKAWGEDVKVKAALGGVNVFGVEFMSAPGATVDGS